MNRLHLAFRHRVARWLTVARNARKLAIRAPQRTLVKRQARYAWSRLTTLHREPRRYTLLSHRRLDNPRGDADEVDAVWELALSGPLLHRHHVGDTLLLKWKNDRARVRRVLEALGADGSHRYPIIGHSSVFQPGRIVWAPLSTILEREIELHVAGQPLLDYLGWHPDTPVSHGIDALTPDAAGGGRGLDLVRVLETAASRVSVSEFLRLQPRNTARAYSLSSIERGILRDRVEIIVSAVQTTVKDPAGALFHAEGRATAYIRTRQTTDTVRAWSLRHPWRLDPHTDRPVVIIVTGTGIAGAIAWLRERRRARAIGSGENDAVNTWLVYGVRDWAARGLYQDELLAMVGDGTLTQLDVAQSRSDEPIGVGSDGVHCHNRVRVPRVLAEDRETLVRWLRSGADVYVSGTKTLGPSVRSQLTGALVDGGLASDAASAARVLESWTQSGRLQISVS